MTRWNSATAFALAGTLTLLTAPKAQADEPEPVHRYEDDRAPAGPVRGKVLLTGAGVTAGFYAPVLGASYLWQDHHGSTDMRIPVAGPWIAVGKTKLCSARPELIDCNNVLQVAGAILLVLDGLGQAGGVGIMLESLFVPTGPRRAERIEALRDKATARRGLLDFGSGSVHVTPVPTVGESDLGLSLVGTF